MLSSPDRNFVGVAGDARDQDNGRVMTGVGSLTKGETKGVGETPDELFFFFSLHEHVLWCFFVSCLLVVFSWFFKQGRWLILSDTKEGGFHSDQSHEGSFGAGWVGGNVKMDASHLQSIVDKACFLFLAASRVSRGTCMDCCLYMWVEPNLHSHFVGTSIH